MQYRIREQSELTSSKLYWIEDYPKAWKKMSLKYLLKYIVGSTPSTSKDKYFEGKNIWVSISDIKNKYISDSKQRLSDEAIVDYSMQKVPKGSLLYTFKLSVGQVSFNEKDLYTNEAIASFLKNKNVNLNFWYYALSKYLVFYANENIYGAKLLNQDLIKNAKLLVPSTNEQQKIANFLDEKSKVFDTAISKKEELITKLEIAKQSLISEVVTGKLKVIKKDGKLQTIKRQKEELESSKVDWLGDIPKNWEIKKLKYATKFNTLKSNKSDFKIALENIESKTTNYIRTKNNVFNDMGIVFKSGDILFGKLRPYLAKVYIPNKNGICVGDFFVLTSILNISINKFVKYLMVSDLFIDIVNGSTYGTKMPRASWDFVGNLKCYFPNVEEQKQISKYLDEKIKTFDNTIEKTKQSITKLKEAKETLISEAVTGKIEIL
ncbi:restriction endonuclease subunit S [Arcobacter sp. YIC-80]|uniref:restriction endonuclease subunit S n=1 Tax=Arcobacter sp. YIC-80 TaxID=3376683 RepID=UPI00384F47BE